VTRAADRQVGRVDRHRDGETEQQGREGDGRADQRGRRDEVGHDDGQRDADQAQHADDHAQRHHP
jgi:hypothetical protein